MNDTESNKIVGVISFRRQSDHICSCLVNERKPGCEQEQWRRGSAKWPDLSLSLPQRASVISQYLSLSLSLSLSTRFVVKSEGGGGGQQCIFDFFY